MTPIEVTLWPLLKSWLADQSISELRHYAERSAFKEVLRVLNEESIPGYAAEQKDVEAEEAYRAQEAEAMSHMRQMSQSIRATLLCASCDASATRLDCDGNPRCDMCGPR